MSKILDIRTKRHDYCLMKTCSSVLLSKNKATYVKNLGHKNKKT